jgi:hypothetical protein
MSPLTFRSLDVYAFLDADSPEAKAFTTYMVYWACLARIVVDTYGQDFSSAMVADLESRRAYRALTASKFIGDTTALRSLLLNAWNSELALYLVDDDDPRLTAQNQWNNVYAYYATGRGALAWLLVRDGQAPMRHRPLLRALAAQVQGSRLFPPPWNLCCSALAPLRHDGFTFPPGDVSNLSVAADPFDMAAKLLKTTRSKRVSELVAEITASRRLVRAPRGESARVDGSLECTSVFDFLWRSRTRANYGNPSMFYMGTLDLARSQNYMTAVRTFTAATMLLFEALIAQRARKALVDAAVHYISRDRTKITDVVLGARLRALGLLK